MGYLAIWSIVFGIGSVFLSSVSQLYGFVWPGCGYPLFTGGFYLFKTIAVIYLKILNNYLYNNIIYDIILLFGSRRFPGFNRLTLKALAIAGAFIGFLWRWNYKTFAAHINFINISNIYYIFFNSIFINVLIIFCIIWWNLSIMYI